MVFTTLANVFIESTGNGEIALFRARLVGQVRRLVLADVPAAFTGIDFVEGVIDVLSVEDIVEDEELCFRAEIALIGVAGTGQIGLGLLGDVEDVTAIGLTGHGIPDVADQDQCFAGLNGSKKAVVGSGTTSMSLSWGRGKRTRAAQQMMMHDPGNR